MAKQDLFSTAYWDERGEFVALVKYHAYGDYYDIRTISGESFRVFAHQLSNFVL